MVGKCVCVALAFWKPISAAPVPLLVTYTDESNPVSNLLSPPLDGMI